MLRKTLDRLLKRFEHSKLYPVVEAMDTFLYEVNFKALARPFIRDGIDIKRWMILVVISLVPCTFMAIWNTGMQEFVYNSGNYELVKEYMIASDYFDTYLQFAFKDYRYLTILKNGALLFLPILLISYTVGGIWEVLFACIRKHPINEGLLVTGLLFPLTLPSTIPYWMVAVGISFGIIIGKEIFGGTGMNILNPALTARAFVYFAFPAYLSGTVWVGGNSAEIDQSLTKINAEVTSDAITQESALAYFNLSQDVKKIHTDAIMSYDYGREVSTYPYIIQKLKAYNSSTKLNDLSADEFNGFMKAPLDESGLGLSADNLKDAREFIRLKLGVKPYTDSNFLFGNRIGSMGETSVIACLIGAFILLITGIGSWRTMLSVIIGVITTAFVFSMSVYLTPYAGAKVPALFDFPIYKQFLMGSLAFGLVFMATDPVSAPTMNLSKYIYGFFIGFLVIIIRLINPAFPEGVFLAILLANVFAPLIDYYSVRFYRRKKRVT
jgi:Na+-transporting NADH:ubiquinone oxidoreductase subunit B